MMVCVWREWWVESFLVCDDICLTFCFWSLHWNIAQFFKHSLDVFNIIFPCTHVSPGLLPEDVEASAVLLLGSLYTDIAQGRQVTPDAAVNSTDQFDGHPRLVPDDTVHLIHNCY